MTRISTWAEVALWPSVRDQFIADVHRHGLDEYDGDPWKLYAFWERGGDYQKSLDSKGRLRLRRRGEARRWRARDSGQLVHGIEYAVAPGTHEAGPAGDLVLKIRTSGWAKIGMDLLFLLADFLYENEDAKYPDGEGGEMLRARIGIAVKSGWGQAQQQLEVEQARKAMRRGGVSAPRSTPPASRAQTPAKPVADARQALRQGAAAARQGREVGPGDG